MVSAVPRGRMTADEFIDWAMTQPGRYELAHGEVVAMAPERSRHALVKARVWRALDDAVRAAGLACVAYPDGRSRSTSAASTSRMRWSAAVRRWTTVR